MNVEIIILLKIIKVNIYMIGNREVEFYDIEYVIYMYKVFGFNIVFGKGNFWDRSSVSYWNV